MVKKEKQVVNAVEETKLEVTPTEEVASVETTPEAPTKKTTRKTKSETTKKTTKTTKAAKETVTVKEVIKEVPVEVVKVVTPQIFFQFAGTEIAAHTIIDQAQAAWVAAGNDANAIESVKVYVKPEEYAAYYVINETETGKIDL